VKIDKPDVISDLQHFSQFRGRILAKSAANHYIAGWLGCYGRTIMVRVLIVDDSATERRLAGGLLEKSDELKLSDADGLLSKSEELTLSYAGDGAEALAALAEKPVDVVVTDLQMPEMDGLELVAAMRVHHPEIPAVLITSRGSETLAFEALAKGAASYVPKSQLADRLVETVNQVIAARWGEQSERNLVKCRRRSDYTFSLENDVALIDPLVDFAQQCVVDMGLDDATGQYRVGIALRHALLNALYRGNLEISPTDMQLSREALLLGGEKGLVTERLGQQPYCDRRIHVRVAASPAQLHYVVRDEGPGFDTSRVPDANFETWDENTGRGLMLMRVFMDEVQFNEQGNEVTLIKQYRTERQT
jgi:CheY-like chemotaxis protein